MFLSVVSKQTKFIAIQRSCVLYFIKKVSFGMLAEVSSHKTSWGNICQTPSFDFREQIFYCTKMHFHKFVIVSVLKPSSLAALHGGSTTSSSANQVSGTSTANLASSVAAELSQALSTALSLSVGQSSGGPNTDSKSAESGALTSAPALKTTSARYGVIKSLLQASLGRSRLCFCILHAL